MKKSLSLMITSFLVLVFAFVLASCPGPETANKITYEDFDAAIKYIKNKGVVATNTPTSNGDLDISCSGDSCCVGGDCNVSCQGGDCTIKGGSTIKLPKNKGFILKITDEDDFCIKSYITSSWSVQETTNKKAKIEEENEDSFSVLPSLCVEYDLNGTNYYLVKYDTSEEIKNKLGENVDDAGWGVTGGKYWVVEPKVEGEEFEESNFEAINKFLDCVSAQVNKDNFDELEFDNNKGYAVELASIPGFSASITVYVKFNSDKRISRVTVAGAVGNTTEEQAIDIDYSENLEYSIEDCPEALPTASSDNG